MNFFQDLPPEQSTEIQQLSRLMYFARENRKDLLNAYDMRNEEELLAAIRCGEVDVLPAYDDYLSARLLGQAREAARARLAEVTTGQPQQIDEPLHLMLAQKVQAEFADALESEPVLLQNALQLVLDNGVEMEIRYADAQHYSIVWQWGEPRCRIDTATGSSRLLREDGVEAADTLTRPGNEPWLNLKALLAAVLADPLLAG
ncbi:MAG: hypothetical protein QG667_2085 [Pseudomonadota bacterium]|jgi:hypothetical protein|nr:hypothetical protein [Pseudomonadota bacterium]